MQLNMKEMIIVGESPNKIPDGAFENKTSLTHLLLPNKLEIIGRSAFAGCSNITGSLHIPEGVTEIKSEAFLDCRGMTGSLSLPTTLKIIGNNKGEGIGAFRGCTFVCELSLPDNLEVIGEQTFYGCNGFYGELYTLAKVGEILGGLTRERIRQIESKALQKIRMSSNIKDLAEYTKKQWGIIHTGFLYIY